jgi:hypothetical protein
MGIVVTPVETLGYIEVPVDDRPEIVDYILRWKVFHSCRDIR